MKRLCYISRNYRDLDGAGNKAKTDNEDTLSRMGAVNLGLARTTHPGKVITFLLDLAGIVKYVFSVRPDDVILLQYPVKKYFSFICSIAHLRRARVIALIHDLGSFRRKKLTVSKEIGRLMHADVVIASNGVMQQWLTEHGFTGLTGALGLFDYRSPSHNATPPAYCHGHARLVYAGALAMRKNAFILQMSGMNVGYTLHIYGNRTGLPGLRDSGSIVCHDFMPADSFIGGIDADFGLVWDGDSLDSCTGNFGEYLRYNSPHKVSFYLRAGLPVIIWRQAAVAAIIEREGIGICIDTIGQLDEVLSAVTPDAYAAMRDNVTRVCNRLDSGWHLTQAVNEACEAMERQRESDNA